MIVYNVTVKIDLDQHDDWLTWIKAVHIPDVIKTGYFLSHQLAKVLVDDSDGITYSIQFRCESMKNLEAYFQHDAPKLQKQHAARYKDKFVAFRTLLEVLD